MLRRRAAPRHMPPNVITVITGTTTTASRSTMVATTTVTTTAAPPTATATSERLARIVLGRAHRGRARSVSRGAAHRQPAVLAVERVVVVRRERPARDAAIEPRAAREARLAVEVDLVAADREGHRGGADDRAAREGEAERGGEAPAAERSHEHDVARAEGRALDRAVVLDCPGGRRRH